MLNRALLALALLMGSGPRGVSAPARALEMRFEEAETVHIADNGGAINRRRGAKVDVELLAGGEVRGTDTGSSSEHNLFPNFSTNEETVWTNRWTGAWAVKGDSLALDLRLAERQCTRKRRMTDAASETLPCGSISNRIRFVCTTRQVHLEGPTGTAHRERTQAAWQCDPPADADLAETPRRWVFGKTACLLVRGGPHEPLVFATCRP